MRKFLRALWRLFTFPFRALWAVVRFPFRAYKKISDFLNQEPEEKDLPEVFATSVQQPSSIFEHINDLRKHLLRILIVLAICVGVMFAFTQSLIDFLARPIGGLSALTAIDVTETVGVFMRVALLGAVVLASPYIAFELWLFAAPGLRPRAKKMGLLGIPLVLVFFISGIAFSYYVLIPAALPFLLNFMGIQALPRVSSYINFVSGLLFWIGVFFQYPLLVYVVSMMGVIQPQILVKGWRIALIVIALAAALITPTGDPVNMSLVMAPMIVLYIIGIGLSYLAQLGRKNASKTS